MANTLESTQPAPSGFFWPFWLALCITFALCGIALLSGVSAYAFIQESGAVETASAAVFACGALGFAVMRPDLAFDRGWSVLSIMLLFTARELDFDKRFTEKASSKLRLYTGDFPLEQQLVGAAFVCLILLTLYQLVRRGWRPLIQGLRNGVAWSWAVVAAGMLVVVAKSLDGAGRKLAPYGIELTEGTTFLFSVIEESFELGFGLVLVFAICTWVLRDAKWYGDLGEFPSRPHGTSS